MTDLRRTIRGILVEVDGDELEAVSRLLQRCDDLEFVQAVIQEIGPARVQAEAPSVTRILDDALAQAGGDDPRTDQLLRERLDPRENPTLAAQASEQAARALARALLELVREENGRR
jgi:hypothetical protein